MQSSDKMLRFLAGAIQTTTRCLLLKQPLYTNNTFSTLITPTTPLLSNTRVQEISNTITRSLIKFSWGKGKRKSVASVLKRFYRLDWGGWIRTKCGRNKKLWKKHAARKRRLRQHVLCNASQSMLLDKMVGSYWRRPKYFVDDPYNPYHTREEFRYTAKQPRPYLGEQYRN